MSVYVSVVTVVDYIVESKHRLQTVYIVLMATYIIQISNTDDKHYNYNRRRRDDSRKTKSYVIYQDLFFYNNNIITNNIITKFIASSDKQQVLKACFNSNIEGLMLYLFHKP